MMQSISQTLKEARLNKFMTQAQLAKKCRVNPAMISAVELGRADPSLTLLQLMCVFLDLEIWIFPKAKEDDDDAKLG